MPINVLVTGAAGNLAHFIYKALMCSRLEVNVVGCNYSHDGVGLYQFDTGYVVPPAKDPAYLPRIIEICKREHIHIVFLGNMAEMRVLAQNRERVQAETGAFVVTSPYEALRRMEDKWETVRYLARIGFDYPRSVLPEEDKSLERFLDEVAFPCMVKDRFGAGSQGVAIAGNRRQLGYLIDTIPNPVIQEYLYPDDEEYTVGVFLGVDGKAAASIVMKRQLGLGMTMKAQVLPDSDLGAYCERMLEDSGCIGPCNVQLRCTERGPVAFEINPRFSSTTSARTHFGYNDVEMCLRHFVLGEAVQRPAVTGGRFYRVIEEVLVDEDTFARLETEGRIENQRQRRRSCCSQG